MRIATKTRYALRFMIDLAQHREEGRVPLKDIAERQGISKKYLEQVVAPLTQAELIVVARGAAGGYQLAQSPEDTTVAQIVAATEGDLNLLDCLEGSRECPLQGKCRTQHVWSGLEDAFATYLQGITLQDALEFEDA